eukprot:gene8030-biopygen9128
MPPQRATTTFAKTSGFLASKLYGQLPVKFTPFTGNLRAITGNLRAITSHLGVFYRQLQAFCWQLRGWGWRTACMPCRRNSGELTFNTMPCRRSSGGTHLQHYADGVPTLPCRRSFPDYNVPTLPCRRSLPELPPSIPIP